GIIQGLPGMSKYVLKDFPDQSALLFDYQSARDRDIPQVNAHLHTPHSFSFFKSIPGIFEQALKENVRVLGINDFFLADGFREFYEEGLKSRIFPMFNIEIVGLMLKEQYDRFRINDPVNPGRTYLSGKGLDYPFHLDESLACRLQNASFEIQLYTKEIIEKAGKILQEVAPGLTLKYSEVKRIFAREFVTERHISRAIRTLIFDKFPDASDRKKILMKLCEMQECTADMSDYACVENMIRTHFLKSGGRAFVAEESSAFLPVSEALQIILSAGGIPCYSVLLDDDKGRCTEYEANKQILLNELLAHNIQCIEFIPSRNHPDILKDYARFFRKNDFLVLFGTAHSTPEQKPLRVCTRDGEYLDEELTGIAIDGASIIAAHQYLRARKERGYVGPEGIPQKDRINEFIALGKAVIHKFISNDPIIK
ncbi:MAG: hypothetical protein KAT15_01280, partial [Bacteroidales bacterium]|nr:hypothetical protein [Bacteroidales bacterium]